MAKISSHPCQPVISARPLPRTFHEDTFNDPYEWLRDIDSSEVRHIIEENNAYTKTKFKSLQPLKKQLFNEFLGHVQQTDLSVPARLKNWWYFIRTQEGSNYGIYCRIPVVDKDNWLPPVIDPQTEPGSLEGEQIYFDSNAEELRFYDDTFKGEKFFSLGVLDFSKDGNILLYSVDLNGNERYDMHIRSLENYPEVSESPEIIENVAAGGCITPDGKWVYYTRLTDAWRPFSIWRHEVGTSVENDEEVWREEDSHFDVGVEISSDEKYIFIKAASKITTEVAWLSLDNPRGKFKVLIPRKTGVEYDVSFPFFGTSQTQKTDIAVIIHNSTNPNFQIDIVPLSQCTSSQCASSQCREKADTQTVSTVSTVSIDRAIDDFSCTLGDGICIAQGSTPQKDPFIRIGQRIRGIEFYRDFIALTYRREGLLRLAVISMEDAYEAFLSGKPWEFRSIDPGKGIGDKAHLDPEDKKKGENKGEKNDKSRDENKGENGERNEKSSVEGIHFSYSEDSCGEVSSSSSSSLRIQPGPLWSIASANGPEENNPLISYVYESWTHPAQLHAIDMRDKKDRLIKKANVKNYDETHYEEALAWAMAEDGRSVPVSLVWKKDKELTWKENKERKENKKENKNKENNEVETNKADRETYLFSSMPKPLFITGYGSYEISEDPQFSIGRLSFLDRGVLYACAHIRGGGELGHQWYEEGKLSHKKNTFTDFIAATKYLQDCKVADRNRTVACGGSAGGLLMGVIINEAPFLYSGIEADVPFVDALTTILNPDLPLTVTEWDEWGDPLHNADIYRYMKSYTPYENVMTAQERLKKFGTEKAPKVFITTSLCDTRVSAVEPLKWLAKLQEPDKKIDTCILLETDPAGHGGQSGRYRSWEKSAQENAWCLSIMGITK